MQLYSEWPVKKIRVYKSDSDASFLSGLTSLCSLSLSSGVEILLGSIGDPISGPLLASAAKKSTSSVDEITNSTAAQMI